jgi:hypothetical protein
LSKQQPQIAIRIFDRFIATFDLNVFDAGKLIPQISRYFTYSARRNEDKKAWNVVILVQYMVKKEYI